MNDDERTILDTQYTEDNNKNHNSASQTQKSAQPSQQQPKNKMGWGEKAAYAGGGAVFGAGMTMAGQAMAAPSAEMPVDSTVVSETAVNKDEETPASAPSTEATSDTEAHVASAAEPQGQAPDPEDAIVATATGVRVAQVDDSASFSQAFADARAQVGPGGIFEWHGRVYATYYKDEWDNMSAAERQDFQANINYNDVLTDESIAQHHNDMAHHSSSVHHDSYTHHTSQPQQPQPNDEDYQQNVDDNEVHVLDVAQTDFNEDGIPEDAALLEVNGHEIIIVDIDRDGVADVAIADIDGDGQFEYGDISGEGIGMPGMSDGDVYLANNDAPDYMNDADVGNYMA